MQSSWEQAKPPGRGLRQLSSHLQAPEDCPLKWSRTLGTGFCLVLAEDSTGLFPWQKETVYEMGVHHSPRS